MTDYFPSLRATEREFGVSRRLLAAAVHRGELRAVQVGRRSILVARADVRRWLDSQAIAPNAHARAVVERRLALERAAAGS